MNSYTITFYLYLYYVMTNKCECQTGVSEVQVGEWGRSNAETARSNDCVDPIELIIAGGLV